MSSKHVEVGLVQVIVCVFPELLNAIFVTGSGAKETKEQTKKSYEINTWDNLMNAERKRRRGSLHTEYFD